MGIERADAVGKLLGQHGHGAIWKINRSAAQARFAIERGIAVDVVRHIGDVNLQLEVAVRERADVDGVIEIARGFAVDGHNGQIAEIAAAAQLRFRHLLLHSARLRQHLRIELVRQMMFADDDFDVNADVARASENFDHAAGGREPSFRIARDFDVDHPAIELGQPHTARGGRALCVRAELLAQSGSKFFTGRDRDLVRNPRVVGQHDVAVRAVAKQAHDGQVLAVDDLHHAAFGAPVGATAHDTRQDVVAIHRVANTVAADEQVAVDARDRMIGYEEAVAVTVSDDAAGNQVRIARTSGLRRRRRPPSVRASRQIAAHVRICGAPPGRTLSAPASDTARRRFLQYHRCV